MKKQSEQKLLAQPNAFCFFVDRCLGSQKIPSGLRALAFQVEIHADHFTPDAEDVVWLEAVGKHGWIVLTKDERIRRDPAERRALQEAGVHAVFFGRQDMSAEMMLTDFGAAARTLMTRLSQAKKPTWLVIRKGGRLEEIKPPCS